MKEISTARSARIARWQQSKGGFSSSKIPLALSDADLADDLALMWQCSRSPVALSLMRKILGEFCEKVIQGMVDYVPLKLVIMDLVTRNRRTRLGDLKSTFCTIFGELTFELSLLVCTFFPPFSFP